MAIAFVIKKILDKEKIDFKGALKKSLSKWPKVIWTSFLRGIFLIGLTLLLIIPGVIYSIYWAFVVYVVVLCDKSGKKVLNYSKSVVKGKWWKVFRIFLGLEILSFLAMIILTILFQLIPEHFILDIFSNIMFDIISAFFVVVITVFFINLDNLKSKELPKEN